MMTIFNNFEKKTNNPQRLVHFGGKSFFLQNLTLPRTTSSGFHSET